MLCYLFPLAMPLMHFLFVSTDLRSLAYFSSSLTRYNLATCYTSCRYTRVENLPFSGFFIFFLIKNYICHSRRTQRFGVMAGSVLRMTVLWWVQVPFFVWTFVLKIRHYAKPQTVSTHPKRPTRPTTNEQKNANASQNSKSCFPLHKPTQNSTFNFARHTQAHPPPKHCWKLLWTFFVH